jgi:hypothetical protein
VRVSVIQRIDGSTSRGLDFAQESEVSFLPEPVRRPHPREELALVLAL